MQKKELIELIKLLKLFLRNDANTYLWAKSRQDYLLEAKKFEGSDFELGGGNFFIALSGLSFLGLLGKIYKILIYRNPQ